MNTLPKRTADTMSDAIALSSPSGRMSKRARQAAESRLHLALFGPAGLQRDPPEPQRTPASLRSYAATLRDLADRGMRPRVHRKLAAEIDAQAAAMEAAP